MILLNLYVVIDYFIILLNDLASAIAFAIALLAVSAKYLSPLFLTLFLSFSKHANKCSKPLISSQMQAYRKHNS